MCWPMNQLRSVRLMLTALAAWVSQHHMGLLDGYHQMGKVDGLRAHVCFTSGVVQQAAAQVHASGFIAQP